MYPLYLAHHIYSKFRVQKKAVVAWLANPKRLQLLLLFWLLMNIALYFKLGVKVVFDSHRYLAYVNSLTSGDGSWYRPDSILYAGYTFFLAAIVRFLQLQNIAVVVAQVLISGIALVCLYKAIYSITRNYLCSFVCSFLYIAWPEIHLWNFYIHTESLYISTSIFILYYFTKDHWNSFDVVACLALLLFSSFLRPNGFFLLIGAIAYFIHKFHDRISRKHKLAFLVIALPVLAYGAYISLEIYSPVQSLLQGHAIQGYHKVRVTMEPLVADAQSPGILQLFSAVIEQPGNLLKLLLLRFTYFWGQIRPYYSTIHNTAIALFFLPVYFYAVKGYTKIRQYPICTFILTVITLQTFMAVTLAVDWDNRFIVPLLPYTFAFTCIGLVAFNIKQSRLTKHAV